MENLSGIVSAARLCLWLGVMILCVILVASGVLRWLAPAETRKKRLNRAGWIAFFILTAVFLRPRIAGIIAAFGSDAGNQNLTAAIINISKITVKLSILGTVVLTASVVLVVLAVIIVKGVRAMVRSKNTADRAREQTQNRSNTTEIGEWAEALKKVSNDFGAIIKTPIFTFFVTCGILIVFVILPFLMGSSQPGDGLEKTWENGVQSIAVVLDESKNITLGEALLTYILIFIIVLGVGFTIIRILHAIVKDNLKERDTANIIDEYSGSMGILGVGVSILFALQNKTDPIFEDKLLDITAKFFKYFVIVAVVMALVIVILEIIRLLMDMRETLIRTEAKYLFIALAGQVSLLVLSVMYMVYSALNSAFGGKLNIDIENIQNKLIHRIIEAMDREADLESGHHDMTFTGFKSSVTKK